MITDVIPLNNTIAEPMFGIRSLLAFVTWIAVLAAVFVAARSLPERLNHLPVALAWDVFTIACMYAALSAVLSDRNRGFYAGFAVFGLTPIFLTALAAIGMFQHPSTGQAILDLTGLGVNPDVAGDDAFTNYIMTIVPIVDLIVATILAIFGGLVGRRAHTAG